MSRLGRVTYRERRQQMLVSGGGGMFDQRSHSEQTAREIDEEIRYIVAQALGRVRQVLEARRPALAALAERLIELETIDNSELKRILDANSPTPMIVPGTEVAAPRRPVAEAVSPPAQAEGAG